MIERIGRYGLPLLAAFFLWQGLFAANWAYLLLTSIALTIWATIVLYQPRSAREEESHDPGLK